LQSVRQEIPRSIPRKIQGEESSMITLEDGLSLCGRCVCGYEVGFITWVGPKTYRIKWRDGETTQARPDLEEDQIMQEAAE
jgi:hypothetical protein